MEAPLGSVEKPDVQPLKTPSSIKKKLPSNADPNSVKRHGPKTSQDTTQRVPSQVKDTASPQSLKKKVPKPKAPETPATSDVPIPGRDTPTPTPEPSSLKKKNIKKKKPASPSNVGSEQLEDIQEQAPKPLKKKASEKATPPSDIGSQQIEDIQENAPKPLKSKRSKAQAPLHEAESQTDQNDDDAPEPEQPKITKPSIPKNADSTKKLIKKKKPAPMPEPESEPEEEVENETLPLHEESEDAQDDHASHEQEEYEQSEQVTADHEGEEDEGEETEDYEEEDGESEAEDYQSADEDGAPESPSPVKDLPSTTKSAPKKVQDTAGGLPDQVQKKVPNPARNTAIWAQNAAGYGGSKVKDATNNPTGAAKGLKDKTTSADSLPTGDGALNKVNKSASGATKKRPSTDLGGLTDDAPSSDGLPSTDKLDQVKRPVGDVTDKAKLSTDDANKKAKSAAGQEESGVDVNEHEDGSLTPTPAGDVGEKAKGLVGEINLKANATAGNVKSNGDGATNNLTGALGGVAEDPKGIFDTVPSKATDAAKGAQDTAAWTIDGAKNKVGGVSILAEDTASGVKDQANNVTKDTTSKVGDLQDQTGGLASQSKDAVGGLTPQSKDLAASAQDKVSQIQLLNNAGKISSKGNNTNVETGGIEISVQTTKDGTTLTIKIPGGLTQGL